MFRIANNLAEMWSQILKTQIHLSLFVVEDVLYSRTRTYCSSALLDGEKQWEVFVLYRASGQRALLVEHTLWGLLTPRIHSSLLLGYTTPRAN